MNARTEAILLPVAAAVTAGSAIASLGARGLLPLPAVLLALLLIGAAGWSVLRWPFGQGAARRRAVAQPVAVASMALIAVLALVRVRSAGADPAELVHRIGTTLSIPLALMLVAQLGSATSLRELGVVLVGSFLCVLLTLGTMPGGDAADLVSGVGVCILIGWSAGLGTLWLLHRAKERARPHHWLGGRGPGLRVPALLVVGSVLAGVAAMLLLPHPSGVQARTAGGLAGGSGSATDAGPAGRSALSYVVPEMDLNMRGALPGTPLAAVPFDSPALWGSTVMVTYTGRGWGPADGIRSLSPAPRDASGDVDLRRGAVAGQQTGAADRTDAVRVLTSDAFLPLLAPGQPVSVRIDDRVGAMGTSLFLSEHGDRPYVMRSNGVIRDPVTPAGHGPAGQRAGAGPGPGPAADPRRADDPGQGGGDRGLPPRARALPARLPGARRRGGRGRRLPVRLARGVLRALRLGRGRAAARGRCPGPAGHRVLGRHSARCRADPARERRARVGAGRGRGRPVGLDRPDRRGHPRGRPAQRGQRVGVPARARAPDRSAPAGRSGPDRGRSPRRTPEPGPAGAALARSAPLAAKVLAAFAALEAALAGSRFARPPDASVFELGRALQSGWPGGLPEPDQVAAALAVVQRVLYDGRPVAAPEAGQAIAALEALTVRAVEVVRVERQRRVRLSR